MGSLLKYLRLEDRDEQVTDQQDADDSDEDVHHASVPSLEGRSARRREKKKELPFPSWLSTATVPPWASTMSFTMARPNPTPVPGPCSGTRKNCSKIRGRYLSGIPTPVSEIRNRTNSPSPFAEMEIVPPGGVYFKAFESKLAKTWAIWVGSTHTLGRASGRATVRDTPPSRAAFWYGSPASR